MSKFNTTKTKSAKEEFVHSKESIKKSKSKISSESKKDVEKSVLKTNNESNNNKDIDKNNVGIIAEGSNTTKKRKGFKEKKKVTGLSNWAILCSEMKKDPCKRKKRKVKKSDDESQHDGPPAKKAKPEIWFDDVDESLLESDDETPKKKKTKMSEEPEPASVESLVKKEAFQGKTKCIGMDCEMVGTGQDGEESLLARVSLVNIYGYCLYDKFVKPREKVTDYRTFVSGITKELIAEKGEPFLQVQREVSDLINGSVLVGHALSNDLRVLFLSHPHKDTRDTSNYKPFRELFGGKMPSLKKLSVKLLGVSVQKGEHSSVEDAQAAMRLYTMHKKKWEKTLKDAYRLRKKQNAKTKKKTAVTEDSDDED